jgi:hypothetical protein
LRGKRERGKRRKLPICHKLAENRQTKKERLRWLLLLVGCGGWLRGEFQRSRQTEGKKQKRSRSFIYAVVRIFVREKKLKANATRDAIAPETHSRRVSNE